MSASTMHLGVLNSVGAPNTPTKSRRGRKKAIGSLVFTERGQEFVVGYAPDGTYVTMQRSEAEQFAAKFYVVKKSLYTRFLTFLYNRHVIKR